MVGLEDYENIAIPGYTPRALDPADYSDSETRS